MANLIKMNLDTVRNSYETLELMQGYTYNFEFDVTQGGKIIDLEGVTPRLDLARSDGTYVIQTDNIKMDKGVVSGKINGSFTSSAGRGKIQLILTKGNEIFGSWVIVCNIKRRAIEGLVEEDDVITILEELDDKIDKAVEVRNETEELVKSGGAVTKGELAQTNSQLAEIENIEIPNLYDRIHQIPKGEKGDPGNGSITIDDSVINNTKTWTSKNIDTKIQNINTNNLATNINKYNDKLISSAQKLGVDEINLTKYKTPYNEYDIDKAIQVKYITGNNKYSFVGFRFDEIGESNTFGMWITKKSLINSSASSFSLIFNLYSSNNAQINKQQIGVEIPMNNTRQGYYNKSVVEGMIVETKILLETSTWIYISMGVVGILPNTKYIIGAIRITKNSVGVKDELYLCNPTFINNIDELFPNKIYNGDDTVLLNSSILKMVKSELVTPNNYIYRGKYNAIGDSLTQGHTLDIKKTYPTLIGNRNYMQVKNYGINGTCIASGKANAICERYVNMDNDAKYITVWGGTNDFFQNKTIGDINSVDTETFKGALNVLCKGLVDKYPQGRIGFITPLHFINNTNAIGLKITDYVDAIIEVCAKYSIPTLDLYRNGNLDLTNGNKKAVLGFGDNVHLSEVGHEFVSYNIENFIRSL